MPTLFDLVCAYGICFGLMNKVDFLRKIDFFDRMFSCSYCTGFHAGWVTWVLSRAVYGVEYSLAGIAPIVCWAFASAAFCYAADVSLQLAESWIPREK